MDGASDRREDTDIDSISISPQRLWSTFAQSHLDRVCDIASRDEPDRVADARQAIDQELAALYLTMCSLHARRNALTPLSRLPPEALARIFWFCGDEGPPNSDPQRLWLARIQSRITHVWDIALPDRPDRLADACQAVDQELVAMHLAICSLRTQRNTLARISCLPSEVLVCIFPLCDGQYDGCILGWIRVTHVCRYWRQIALQSPSLWNRPPINYLGSRWLNLMLSRAKTAPLFLNLTRYFKDDILHVITKYISQTRDLVLQRGEIRPILQALSPSNSLESLTIGLSSTQDRNLFMLETFRDNFPRLRRLNLTEVNFHWSSPIFCGLTHLYLDLHSPRLKHIWNDYVKSSCNTPPIYDSFFCALGKMSGLEVLVLINSLPPRPQHFPLDHIATLPRLTELCLDDEIAVCFDIVKQLEFPPSCRLILKPEKDYDDSQCFVEILPVLKDHAGNVDQPPLIFSVGAYMACYEVSMHRNRDLLDTTAPDFQISAVPDLFLRIPHTDWLTVNRVPLQAVCETIALDHIRVLIIDYTHTSPERVPTVQEWIDIFGRCKAVEHVRITSEATSFFLALLPASQQDSQRGLMSQRLFLENLQSITLMSVNFNDPCPEFEDTTVADLFLRCLAIRKEAKALPTIRIAANCNYHRNKCMEELEAMTKVEWLPMDEDE